MDLTWLKFCPEDHSHFGFLSNFQWKMLGDFFFSCVGMKAYPAAKMLWTKKCNGIQLILITCVAIQ